MNKGLLKKIFPILKSFDIPYLLIGGYAAAIWGNVRATKDVDFLVNIPDTKVVPVVDEFKNKGFEVEYRRGDIGDPIFGVIHLKFLVEGVKESIELLLGIKKMPVDIYLRAEKINLEEVEIPVVSPEDLIILKLLAGGPIDLQDAGSLSRIMADSLDFGYLGKELRRCKLSFNFD